MTSVASEQFHILARGARPRVLAKYLGQLAALQAALLLAPVLVSLIYDDLAVTIRHLALQAGLLLIYLLTRRIPAPQQMQNNEAYSLVALAFCLSPLLMAIPMALGGIHFIDALFEAVSGVTTTGLSTLASVQDKSHTFLFARAWMQWYGGLGIVVLSIALISDHHLARRQFMEGLDRQHLVSETRVYARSMLRVYVTLTLLGTLLLWSVMGNGFDALLLTMSAISTGGYAPYNDSLLSLPASARGVVTLISTLGAIALPIYLLLWRRHWRSVLLDTELQVFFALALAVSSALAALRLLHLTEPLLVTVQESLVLGFAAQSTTGFASQPPVQLDAPSKIIVMLAMLLGGGLGSTAGGIKIMRLIMLWKALFNVLQRSAIPAHAVMTNRIGNITISDTSLQQALVLILITLVLLGLSWWPFILAGHDPLNALFEVVSALGTVGLSVGITAPDLAPGLKTILMFDMIAGRLEVFALLILLYPRTWLARKDST